MTNQKEKKHVFEPPFHIVRANVNVEGKRAFLRSMGIRVLAFLVGLVISAAIVWIFCKFNPSEFVVSLGKGSFGSVNKIWKVLRDTALLLGVALALTPAFKMKFWNIGGEGQVLMGAFATYTISYYLGGKISTPLLIAVMALAGILAGAIWGLIPAIFKALWNTNETLFTLMMNYVAIQLVSFFIGIWAKSGSNNLWQMTHGRLPIVIHINLLPILIVAVLTVLMFVYLKYAKQGYEISVVGESEKTAKYIGINVKKVIIRTMAVSGAICGLIGFLIVGAFDYTLSANSARGMGFTAIMVSWLGKFNPFYMAATSFIITFLERGGAQMNSDLSAKLMNNDDIDGSPTAMTKLIVAIILMAIIGCEFFLNYRIVINDKYKIKKKTGKGGVS